MDEQVPEKLVERNEQRLAAVAAGELSEFEADSAAASEMIDSFRELPIDELMELYDTTGTALARRASKRVRKPMIGSYALICFVLGERSAKGEIAPIWH